MNCNNFLIKQTRNLIEFACNFNQRQKYCLHGNHVLNIFKQKIHIIRFNFQKSIKNFLYKKSNLKRSNLPFRLGQVYLIILIIKKDFYHTNTK